MDEIKNTTPNLEEEMESLKEIISKLEEPTISLEASFELYKKGLDKLESCNGLIDKIEKELIVLEEGN